MLVKKEQETANVMIYGLPERGLSIGLWRHVLWISEENSVDKLSSLATAAHRLHSVKAFLFHTLSPTASWLGVGKRLGGAAAGPPDIPVMTKERFCTE